MQLSRVRSSWCLVVSVVIAESGTRFVLMSRPPQLAGVPHRRAQAMAASTTSRGIRTIPPAMTVKEQLQRAIDGLSDEEAADVLLLVSQSRDLGGDAATRILDGIDGAYERAQLGVDQAQSGQTTSLDDLDRASR